MQHCCPGGACRFIAHVDAERLRLARQQEPEIDLLVHVIALEVAGPFMVAEPVEKIEFIPGIDEILTGDFFAVEAAEIISATTAAVAGIAGPPPRQRNGHDNDEKGPQPLRMFAHCSDHTGKIRKISVTTARRQGKPKNK